MKELIERLEEQRGAFPSPLYSRLKRLVPDNVHLNNIGGVANHAAEKSYKKGERYRAGHRTATAKWYAHAEKILGKALLANELKAFDLMFDFFLQRIEGEGR